MFHLALILFDFNNMTGHEIVKDVLTTNPQAASKPDRYGNLPLHVSLHTGKTWNAGVKEIFEAAPYAIDVRDHKSQQYPFMIAAYKKIRANDITEARILTQTGLDLQHSIFLSELTTVFELLRRSPNRVND